MTPIPPTMAPNATYTQMPPTTEHVCSCSAMNQYQCDDCQLCYHDVQKCDGTFDCEDGSDEMNCPCTYDGVMYAVSIVVYILNIKDMPN